MGEWIFDKRLPKTRWLSLTLTPEPVRSGVADAAHLSRDHVRMGER